jgi:hypothetical protein
MATSFLPHVPAKTDKNAFRDTGIGFREQMRVPQRCRKISAARGNLHVDGPLL